MLQVIDLFHVYYLQFCILVVVRNFLFQFLSLSILSTTQYSWHPYGKFITLDIWLVFVNSSTTFDTKNMLFFLYCSDLSSITSLKQVILNSFSPPSEEVKSAASYALGSIAVGNLPEYLPFVLQEIESKPKRQYLLLHSLKEVRNFVMQLFNLFRTTKKSYISQNSVSPETKHGA